MQMPPHEQPFRLRHRRAKVVVTEAGQGRGLAKPLAAEARAGRQEISTLGKMFHRANQTASHHPISTHFYSIALMLVSLHMPRPHCNDFSSRGVGVPFELRQSISNRGER